MALLLHAQTYAALASVCFLAAFIAAWTERPKRTPGTLIGLASLGVLALAIAGPAWVFQTITTFSLTSPPPIGWDIAFELVGLMLAGVAIFIHATTPRTFTLPETPIKKMLDNRSIQLRHAEQLAESMMRSALGAKIVLTSTETPTGHTFTVRMVNGSIEQLFGAPSSKLVNQRLEKVCPPHLFAWFERLAKEAIHSRLPCQDERRFDVRHTQWLEMRAVAFPGGVTLNISDITDRRRIEDALRREAMTDPLTGLANRAHLKASLAEAVHRVNMNPGRGLSLFYIDFDRFKVINDSLGHDVGDDLLRSIADRLRETCSVHRSSTVRILPARLGGDEFVILAEGMCDENVAQNFAQELIETFIRPHEIGLHTVVSTASIGLLTDHGSYHRAESILRDVDMAMYAAKEAGKSRYVVFDQSLRERALSVATLENDLRVAIEREEFDVAYQPIIDLKTGEIHSFEALIRWNHPARGTVHPDQFIPMAEELDLISEIGEQVLRKACIAAVEFHQVSAANRPIPVAVNHSKRELLSPRFVERLADILEETGAPAELIKIEVTESVCVSHQSMVVPVLNGIRALGVQTVVDDFGTGDSSFSCIEEFPLDQLKIDRKFLHSDRDVETRRAILTSMIEMAKGLNVPAVCEGIETAEELDLMLTLGCDLGQGWVFTEALPREEAVELAASGLARWIENMPLLERIKSYASHSPKAA